MPLYGYVRRLDAPRHVNLLNNILFYTYAILSEFECIKNSDENNESFDPITV